MRVRATAPRAVDHRRGVEPVEAEVGDVRHRLVAFRFCHPADNLPTVVEVADRKRDEASPRLTDHDHPPAAEQRRHLRRATPHRHAAPQGRSLVGQEHSTGQRIDAVARDDDVGIDRSDRGRVEEATELHAIGPEPIEDRLDEHVHQRRVLHGVLRPPVSGGQSEWLQRDLPAVTIVATELADAHGLRIELGCQAELCEFANGVRTDVDADIRRVAHLGLHG